MAKLCNEQFHCDFSTHGPRKAQVHTSSSSHLATIDWVDRVEKVACVKTWWNRKCHCEGYFSLPCGDTKGALIYNIPNSRADGTDPTRPGQRIFSERKWQTKVPKSELPTMKGVDYQTSRNNKVNTNKTSMDSTKTSSWLGGLASGLQITRPSNIPTQTYYPNVVSPPNSSYQNQPNPNAKNGGEDKSKNILYIGIGLGVVAIIIVMITAIKRR